MSQHKFDVAIVGAGASGISAAVDLAQSGVKVLLIEARDRIGGRILTRLAPNSDIVELGAEFLHGEEAAVPLTHSGLEVTEIVDDHKFFLAQEIHGEPQFWDKLDHAFSLLRENSHRERSFSEVSIQIADPLERLLAETFVEGFHAADLKLIGENGLARAAKAEESQKLYRVKRGYAAYMETLWKLTQGQAQNQAPLVIFQKSTRVQEINWAPDPSELNCKFKDGSLDFLAKKIIITVPVGVLKQNPIHSDSETGVIQFKPTIEQKLSHLQAIEMGAATKLVFCFREPFWKKSRLGDLGFIHAPELTLPTWWSAAPVKSGVLTAWTGGPNSQKLSFLTQKELLQAALRSLCELCEMPVQAIERQLLHWDYHNWQMDPFARGAYSYLGVGGVEAQKRFAEPVENKLFFAGEATHTEGELGTVLAAVESGKRAAREVLQSLK